MSIKNEKWVRFSAGEGSVPPLDFDYPKFKGHVNALRDVEDHVSEIINKTETVEGPEQRLLFFIASVDRMHNILAHMKDLSTFAATLEEYLSKRRRLLLNDAGINHDTVWENASRLLHNKE